jgi:5'-phosphate synthase pdxT subunit
LTATFIRAPKVTRTGPEVKVLATYHGDPVLLRQNNVLAGAFHTELDEDTTLLEYFLTEFD